MPLSPGTKLGQYEVVEAIGAGGMGEVYRARDTKLRRDVAVKVLPEEFSQTKSPTHLPTGTAEDLWSSARLQRVECVSLE